MPLLNKQLFIPNPPPIGLPDDTEIYYCEQTKEVFLTHEDYYKRIMLLNTTVWSCSMTRKSNLTYFEAVKSEQEAEQDLLDFPKTLERPILFIVQKYTNRGRFEELVNDIYHIMKDRYFTNEEVTYSEKNRKIQARVITSYLIEEPVEMLETEQEIKEPILQPPESYRYTIEVIGVGIPDHERFREEITHDKLFRSKNVGARQKIRLFLKTNCHLPPDGDRYTIRECHIENASQLWWSDVLSGPEPICPQTPVQQRGRIPNMLKPGFSHEENKEKKAGKEAKDSTPRARGRPPQTPEQKALKEQEKKIRKRQEAGKEHAPDEFDLTQSGALTLSFIPNSSPWTPSTKKARRSSNVAKSDKKKAKIQEQQDDLGFFFKEAHRLGIDIQGLEQDERLLSPKKVAEFKQKVKEGKDAEREMIREEKKRKLKEKAAYNKKREDLICNDLKPLPKFPALEIPEWMNNEEFGSYIFILQFYTSFKEILPLKEIRGNEDVTFSDVVLAIKCNDPQNSPFADLMRVLLSVRTDIADEEDGDEADYNNREEMYLINTQNCDPVNATHGDSIREISDFHMKIRKTYGKSVRHLPVDWMTLSEVLRLIFETSGYYTGISTHRHRLYARGNFRGYEDPAYEFRVTRADILEKLRTQTVFDLEQNDRLKIMETIIYQLLTYSKFRNYLETIQTELGDLKKEQKKLKGWHTAQEGESNAARLLLELESDHVSENKETPIVKRLKAHIKAHNEGRRYDKEDLDTILLDTVPYTCLTLDEIVTARELQKIEYKTAMDTLSSKLFTIYCKASNKCLGSDRAYRRYIVMQNMSAILIETSTTSELGAVCDEPTRIENVEYLEENPSQEVFQCTGHMESCLIHGEKRNSRSRWCYIESRQQFEQLLQSLNPRGYREVELLEELSEYRRNLLEILEETEKSKEEWKSMLMTDDPDPAETYNIDWDAEIRDLLLDFEEKLDQGLMGSIEKVFGISRVLWRQSLKETGNVRNFLKEDDFNEISLEELSDAKNLAIAFFMIVRSINLKFIKPPFLSPNRDEHGNLKGSELFNRWQKALLECESHSALSLFITTIEGSIKWDKSRLQAKCKSCRRKAAVHELVLCSGCDSCYHLKCAKLGMKFEEVPTDWECTTCKAQKRKVENEAKRQKLSDPQEDLPLKRMSIDDDDFSNHKFDSSYSKESNTIKTLSGRSVKKIQYMEAHAGLSLSTRVSNGSTSKPTTSVERPVRNVSFKSVGVDNESDLSEDEYDGENTRKRKVAVKKSTSINDLSHGVNNSKIKEKMSSIEQLLKETMRKEFSWPFLQPVETKEVPDYYDVIKRPMDLRTMMNKIKQRIYNTPTEVRSDFELILSNCETYNETESEIYQLSQELDAFVTGRLNALIEQ